MREILIQKITESINGSKKPFLREQDIQMKIINDLKNSQIEIDNIFFEYNIKTNLLENLNYPWVKDKNVFIDIVIEIKSKFYPIEIKYKTIKQEFNQNIFGENDLLISTEKHGASNLGCYDLWKDVKRLEVIKERFVNVQNGIILFVTNDESYKRLPLNNNVGYANFSIHEGRNIVAGTVLFWNGELAIAESRPPFILNNNYFINWKELNTEHWNKLDNSIKHFYFIL
jgi:hypothetical protein